MLPYGKSYNGWFCSCVIAYSPKCEAKTHTHIHTHVRQGRDFLVPSWHLPALTWEWTGRSQDFPTALSVFLAQDAPGLPDALEQQHQTFVLGAEIMCPPHGALASNGLFWVALGTLSAVHPLSVAFSKFHSKFLIASSVFQTWLCIRIRSFWSIRRGLGHHLHQGPGWFNYFFS